MKSPILNNQDPADCTPEQCGLAFVNEAQRLAQVRNIPLTQAWQVARVMHPEVYNRLIQGRPVDATGTDPEALDDGSLNPALANVYREVLADELTKNGGDIYRAHRAAMARPEVAGQITPPTLRKPFPVNATQFPVLPSAVSQKTPFATLPRPRGLTLGQPVLANDTAKNSRADGSLAFLASAQATDGDKADHETAAYAHQQAADAATASGNSAAAAMFGQMAQYHTICAK